MGWGERPWKWGVQCEVTEDERSRHGRNAQEKRSRGNEDFYY